MGEPGKSLRIRVQKQKSERHWRKKKGRAIQARRGAQKENHRGGEKKPDVRHRQGTGRESALCGARIGGVDFAICQPIVRHRRASSADHGEQNLKDRGESRDSLGGENGREQSEGQGEKGVRELDHLESRGEGAAKGGEALHERRRRRRGFSTDHRKSSPGTVRPSHRAARTQKASTKRPGDGSV